MCSVLASVSKHACLCVALDTLITKLDYRIRKKKPAKKFKEVGDPVYKPTPSGLKKWMVNPMNEMTSE